MEATRTGPINVRIMKQYRSKGVAQAEGRGGREQAETLERGKRDLLGLAKRPRSSARSRAVSFVRVRIHQEEGKKTPRRSHEGG